MFCELYSEIKFFVRSNMYPMAVLASALLPAACFVVGTQCNVVDAGTKWLFVAVIVAVQFVLYSVKWYATRIGKGQVLPSPATRFTTVSEDGEVTADADRMQEMLLYVADVEDFLERKGLLSKGN